MLFDRLQEQILFGSHIFPLLDLGHPNSKSVGTDFANIPFELK